MTMHDKDRQFRQIRSQGYQIGLIGLFLGILIGLIIGLLLGNPMAGAAFGVAIGAGIGLTFMLGLRDDT
jgi:uncharacterized membrane protein